MEESLNGSSLIEAVADLREAASRLRRNAETPQGLAEPPLSRLVAAVEGLGQDRPARRPESSDVEQCRRLFLRGENLTRRAVRVLCWEPEIALDPQFHYQAEKQGLTLGVQGIQGLVRACHVSWSLFLADETIQRLTLRALRSYEGPNRVLKQWQRDSDSILTRGAPLRFGERILGERRSPGDAASVWHLDEGTEFLEAAVTSAIEKARALWQQAPALSTQVCDLLLSWDRWSFESLRARASECILDRGAQLAAVQEALKRFLLRDTRFGDPRLPANRPNWRGVERAALQQVIEWLSRADIVFFFDHVFPKGGDKHRRKPFWLRYVSQVRSSRPLLDQDDYARLKSAVQQLKTDVGNQGARVILTPRSGDEGVDVICIRGSMVELVQCKHTLWDAVVDADVVAEVIQAFDGYRAKRFRAFHGRSTLRATLITNGKLTARAKRDANERDVRIHEGDDLLRLLAAYPCSAADIESASTERLASMRDVQARIATLFEPLRI